MKDFTKKTAIVTGAGGGIGRATAMMLASQGAQVVVSDVQENQGNETVEQIKNEGGRCIFIKTDVSNSQDVQEMIRQTVNTFGGLNYLVNNAGVGGPNALAADHTEDNWNRIISINLTGAWLCMKYAIPQMLNQGGGVIVNVASVTGLTGLSHVSAYTAAKHGVIGLTKSAALEYAPQGIRVVAVCPGFVRTSMMDQAAEKSGVSQNDFYNALSGFAAMQRVAIPEEIAQGIVWLCSDAASFITGSSLTIDGGWVSGYRLR